MPAYIINEVLSLVFNDFWYVYVLCKETAVLCMSIFLLNEHFVSETG